MTREAGIDVPSFDLSSVDFAGILHPFIEQAKYAFVEVEAIAWSITLPASISVLSLQRQATGAIRPTGLLVA
jgi:hypothetical protein